MRLGADHAHVGDTIAPLGDLDHDGFDDLLIGAGPGPAYELFMVYGRAR